MVAVPSFGKVSTNFLGFGTECDVLSRPTILGRLARDAVNQSPTERNATDYSTGAGPREKPRGAGIGSEYYYVASKLRTPARAID